MYLKFVDRQGSVPHKSLMIECDSFREHQARAKVGEQLDKYSPTIAGTHWPFEVVSTSGGPYRTREAKEETQLLFVEVVGARGYDWIAGHDMILFVMNNEGKTIDKTVV